MNQYQYSVIKKMKGTVTPEQYAAARDALDRLAEERARIILSRADAERGLSLLREWLAAGAGAQWLAHEAVVVRARDADLAMAMWMEWQWRRAKNKLKAAKQQPARSAPAASAPKPTPKLTTRPSAKPQPAPTARSFAPGGLVWRP